MAEPGSGQRCKGLDLGTSRIVLATGKNEKPQYQAELNAFLSLPFSRMTVDMLDREEILYDIENSQILAYGNRVDEFANIFGGDTRRPMQTGMLNPHEPESLRIMQLAVNQMAGKAKKGDKICFSIPSPPPKRESDLVYHEQTIMGVLEDLGYEVQSINEGLAIVYSELKDSKFTGIGMSFGGGMCNVCLAYLGLPAVTFCTTRAGDYIDHSTASVIGKTPTTVRLHKESDFQIAQRSEETIDQALSVYYRNVMQEVVKTLEETLATSDRLPTLHEPLPVVCSGGTASVKGFDTEMKKQLSKAKLPVEIGEVRLAADPLNATAKGALISALTNM